jgi:hypothetical protein
VKIRSLLGVALATSISAATAARAETFVADAFFTEWNTTPVLQTDPSGDSSGAFDVTEIRAASRGTKLFLRFDTGVDRNLISGAGSDGQFDVIITLGGDDLVLDYRNRSVSFPGMSLNWTDIDAVLQPTFAASEFELSVDLFTVGANVGETVEIAIAGADTVAPAMFTLVDPAQSESRRTGDRDPATDIRISSLNTLNSGLIGGSANRFKRLIDAVDADIYCFQEEYNSSANDIANVLESTDPFGDGASWNIQKNNDCVIASRSPLIGAPESNTKYVAALVDLGAGDAVFVLSIHPKCCGYIGSSEDSQRIGEMQDMADTITDFRAGALGGSLAPYANAPVIVIGDFNLVGSRAPLDVLLDAGGPNLSLLTPRGLIGADVLTWISGSSSFAPGRLDLLTYDAAGLFPVDSFLLDSRVLTPAELSSLGLQASDSGASDHLMMVADFSFDPVISPDLNGDGFVNGADLATLLAQWGGAGSADLNGDGTIDGADLAVLLAAWG